MSKQKFAETNVYYTLQGRRIKQNGSVYVERSGPLEITLKLINLFYSSGGQCVPLKPRYVNFVVQGPLDIGINESFAITSDNMPIVLSKRLPEPPYQVSFTVPKRKVGTRLMYFMTAYPELPWEALEDWTTENVGSSFLQVFYLTEKERENIDPNFLRRFPRVNNP